MGTGAREVARLLWMGPNTDRDDCEALEAAGLLDGSVDDLTELAVFKEAVQPHVGSASRRLLVGLTAAKTWRGRLLLAATGFAVTALVHCLQAP